MVCIWFSRDICICITCWCLARFQSKWISFPLSCWRATHSSESIEIWKIVHIQWNYVSGTAKKQFPLNHDLGVLCTVVENYSPDEFSGLLIAGMIQFQRYDGRDFATPSVRGLSSEGCPAGALPLFSVLIHGPGTEDEEWVCTAISQNNITESRTSVKGTVLCVSNSEGRWRRWLQLFEGERHGKGENYA